MIATADTGFVAKLYLVEPESAQARTIISGITPPVLLTAWHTLEVANTFQRAVFSKTITPEQAQGCWQDFEADQAAGLFKIVALDHARLLESAQRLTRSTLPPSAPAPLILSMSPLRWSLEPQIFSLSMRARKRRRTQRE